MAATQTAAAVVLPPTNTPAPVGDRPAGNPTTTPELTAAQTATMAATLPPAGLADANLSASLAAAIQPFVDNGQFMGAVLVAQDGQVLLSEGYGFADLDQDRANMSATPFLIGSLTKQFTAAAILQLQDAGRLSVSDPLVRYLPDYPGGAAITLHHLLNHTSGVPEHVGRLRQSMATPFPIDDLIGTFSSLPLDFVPGSQFAYSNSNYVLLGKVIEVVTGQPYADYVQEQIFDPLQMAQTGYGRNEGVPGQSVGYTRGPGGAAPAQFVDMSIPYAAGALVSTVEDFYLWDRALRADSLLSPAGKEAMFTPGQGDYGYGWFITASLSGRVAFHGGSIFGYRSYIVRGLDTDFLIIVLSNLDSAPVPNIADALQDVLEQQ
jgi:CubicO group peptidase (beta-lactamase class C family)